MPASDEYVRYSRRQSGFSCTRWSVTRAWQSCTSNVACYACQLRDFDGSKERLAEAFKIDLGWRILALEDEDLQPLWDSLLHM